MPPAVLAPPVPRLVRVRGGRVLGGVAAGLAQHLGIPVLWVRAALLVLAVAGGSGLALYGLYWLVLPLADDDAAPDSRAWGQVAALVVLAVLAVGTVVVLGHVGVPGGAALPLVPVAVGAALVWRQVDDARRARWRGLASQRPGGLALTGLGVVLLALGITGFLATRGELQAAREGLLSTVVVIGGLGLLVAPWATRVLGELQAERRERIRSQERADLAAQVHDSVLQTLALIQQTAGDPREVTRLARVQERELRSWLYRPAPGPVSTLSAVLEQSAVEVEQAHGVPVEVVHVGDVAHEGPVVALAAAAREAVVNAARHSGADLVQVYAEVEDDRATVFVRDRGCGFDPAQVPADRFGLQQSVVGRVERAGGTAVLRTSPGEGTEVQLQVPRG